VHLFLIAQSTAASRVRSLLHSHFPFMGAPHMIGGGLFQIVVARAPADGLTAAQPVPDVAECVVCET
jgi:hypothetical protein